MSYSGYPPSVAVPLPPGWECKWDATTGKYFYIDHVNKKTQWNAPTGNRGPVRNASPHLSPTQPPARDLFSGQSTYASSTITSRTSSSRSESVNSDDESSGRGRSRGAPSSQIVANADIKRRLQLKFNANQTYQQQIINEVLVACKNNEKEAEKKLEGMGFKMKSSNITKPKMANPTQKANTLTQAEKDAVLRRAKILIGSKYTEDEIKKCAEKHNYHVPAMLAEYQKTLNSTPTTASTTTKHSTSSSYSTSPVGQQSTGSTSKAAASQPSKQKASTSTSPSVLVDASSSTRTTDATNNHSNDIWTRDNTASPRLPGMSSHNEHPRARSSSELWSGRAKGPSYSLAKGADPSLRSKSHLAINGQRASCQTSTRSSLAKGPRVLVRGPDASLAHGSSMANIALCT